MKERSFVRRNKRVLLNELTNLVAVRQEDSDDISPALSEISDQIAPEVPESEWNAFQKAGWVLRERPSEEDPSATPHAQVFVKSGGRLALGTNELTVQFKDDIPEAEANTALEPFGSRVVERLTFAPGLFRVAVANSSGDDAVEVANKLSDSGLVQFAEPELIEVISHR
jgi:fervidolysin-like protein